MEICRLIKVLRMKHHRFYIISYLFFICFALISFLCVQNVYSMDITLAWDEVIDPNLVGYRLFYREEGQSYNYSSPDWYGVDTNCTIYNLDENTAYYFVARAYDSEGNESGNSNEVYYLPQANTPPNADAGSDQEVDEADTVTLNGLNSNDPDGSIDTYSWAQTSGPLVTLADSNTVQTSFTAPYVGPDGESLMFQLTVTDNEGSQSTDVCRVNVSDSMNFPPVSPDINSPSDGTTENELMPQIISTAYSDPENDSHSQSHWQISKQQGDFSSPVLDITSTEHLTELIVPHLVLDPNTTYYVRVQYSDEFSANSDWSDTIQFSTNSERNDLDFDGIPDEKEVTNYIDLNGDEINDNDQQDVIKCITLPDNLTIIGISKVSASITAIEALDTIDPSSIPESPDKPGGLSFGLFSYRLQVDRYGATASVRIYFSEDISHATNFYKFDTIYGWQDCTENVTFNEDGRSITITIEDGGFGDSDGVANGIIVDPGGLVTLDSIGSNTGTSDTGTGSSGCFISTLGGFSNQFDEH